jgi:hypothetical protein
MPDGVAGCVDDAPVELITASYNHEEDQFRVVVTGHGQSRTGTSPDVVTARELADRLVTRIVPAAGAAPVVVHLLDGSAVAFTNALLTARFRSTVDRRIVIDVRRHGKHVRP